MSLPTPGLSPKGGSLKRAEPRISQPRQGGACVSGVWMPNGATSSLGALKAITASAGYCLTPKLHCLNPPQPKSQEATHRTHVRQLSPAEEQRREQCARMWHASFCFCISLCAVCMCVMPSRLDSTRVQLADDGSRLAHKVSPATEGAKWSSRQHSRTSTSAAIHHAGSQPPRAVHHRVSLVSGSRHATQTTSSKVESLMLSTAVTTCRSHDLSKVRIDIDAVFAQVGRG